MRPACRTDEPAAGRRQRLRLRRDRGPADYILPALALTAFFFYARPVVLPVIIACIVGMALKPGMQWFARGHIPASVAAALMVGGFLAAAGCFFYYVARPAVQWASQAPAATGEFRQKVEGILHLHPNDTPPPKPGNLDISQPIPLQMPNSQTTSTILAWTGATLAGVAETIVLLYLTLVSNGWFSKKLAVVLAPRFKAEWVTESFNELQRKISCYLFSITLINIVFGVLIGSGLALIGLPNAAMWGGIAAIFNFIPYFGPFVGMVIVGIVGILTFDSGPKEVLPLALYFGLHLLEADFVTPAILGQRFTIHPLIIFISLLFWTWLWGVPGAFLAVPMLVALKVGCERHPPLSAIGALLTK